MRCMGFKGPNSSVLVGVDEFMIFVRADSEGIPSVRLCTSRSDVLPGIRMLHPFASSVVYGDFWKSAPLPVVLEFSNFDIPREGSMALVLNGQVFPFPNDFSFFFCVCV